jgi:hypothetical protein
MKIKKLLLLLLIALMVVSFIGCKGGGGTDKTPEPTDTPAPTDTPEPTATPTPTPEPTPDPDEGVDAVLYRFALEGENIIDTMFEGNDINPTYAEAEFTEEGLHLTVVDFHDPIFNLPMPDGAFLKSFSYSFSQLPNLNLFFQVYHKNPTKQHQKHPHPFSYPPYL